VMVPVVIWPEAAPAKQKQNNSTSKPEPANLPNPLDTPTPHTRIGFPPG
jgi:hypothetical protein